MKHRLNNLIILCGLLFFLAACSGGTQADVNNEFWTGTSQLRGSSGTLDAFVGFTQTGNEVRAKWAFNIPGSLDIIYVPTMSGTINGLNIEAASTDAGGNTGTFRGTFDQSQQNLIGTLTVSISGQESVADIVMAYDQPLRDTSPLNPSGVEEQSYETLQRLFK